MRARADRSAPPRRIPAGAAADPRRPSSRPRRLSYAVAVANSPIDKSAALALRRPLMRWGTKGAPSAESVNQDVWRLLRAISAVEFRTYFLL